ncbi:MAG: Protein translocase subunit SecY [Parcubacteria group bacterium GW2011_GWF2_39_8b]|uniref:Protein translocase subunit SecY n=3 Tax=Candidatus Zambryskiibacteriota TaxID=1817925 RepID=A0A1G2T5W6_9BACT|nr:MAG: Protein translocase subunit SecY [Parcubacteria group bacterium GW2011_GWF2_39_8b]KKR46213.1 MAG: Protein translocase subunit SecY [Parcubacteria group bacterium GW2011_GWA2_40_14]OHA92670.1 MAG: preprotein translocase subunit SecY [Candidatus Zambryskibacteria bacterium RIFCSPHIGHO2_02_38_10.5]OHA97269.1 MAG: preprotein translocase subunit SecY [Candidatus Zambryskibacteria bacterium RIFCSPHIGHO2_12_FULL_38_37]OHA97397.1 MAG: preprotein translocase subunit SecY [Candidatus Zambryskibac
MNKLKLVLQDKILRKRILFTLSALVIFRILASIPVPGVDGSRLAQFFASNEFFGLLNIFSGGGLSQLSIVMLGVGPYITGSIIMQLSTIMFPKLKEMYQEEGQAGRRKFAQYGRILTIPLALIQGFSFIKILQSQQVLGELSYFTLGVDLIIITAGSILLMWIGELISEYGVGNGLSLIIFAGIVASLPATVSQLIFAFDPAQLPLYIVAFVASILVIIGVVIITEAERPIPVTYAKQVRGNRVYGGTSTYLPLRINQAGVIPIIFALSILLFPQMILRFLQNSSYTFLSSISRTLLDVLANQWFYAIAYFFLVFVFTYFYTAVTFDPDQISTNLQKNGAFIPGVRPGHSTSEHISRILTRLTLVGAIFLGFIAVLPLIMSGVTGITAISIGGTALLIVVSVVIDLIKKIDAQVSIREY